MHMIFRIWGSKARSSLSDVPSKPIETDNNLPFELDTKEPYFARKPKSIRRLRLGRCYIDFGWLPATRRGPKTCDNAASQSHKKRRRISELSADPIEVGRLELLSYPLSPVRPLDQAIRELPDQASMEAAILEKNAVYELESPTLGNFNPQTLPMNISDDAFETNEPSFRDWNTPFMFTTRQASPSTATHYNLPKIITQEHLEAPPGLASTSSSHNPSPTSPITPSLEMGLGVTAPQYTGGPIAALPSSIQPVQHSTDHSLIEEYVHEQYESDILFPGLVTSFASPAAEFFDQVKPIPKYDALDGRFIVSDGSLTTDWNLYRHFDPMSTGPSEMIDELLWDTNACYTEEIDPPSYTFRTHSESLSGEHGHAIPESFDGCEKPTVPNNNSSCSIDNLQQETNNLQLCLSGAIHRRGAIKGRAVTTAHWPTKRCDMCGNEFTGQYAKGNLARHIRERHGLVQSMVGKVCRVCKQAFNRADATRKHEWKKHRLSDARPNKRRKER